MKLSEIQKLIDECHENLAPSGGPCLRSIEAAQRELNRVVQEISDLEFALAKQHRYSSGLAVKSHDPELD